jgi:hypothetical protein
MRDLIQNRFRDVHGNLLRFTKELSVEQLNWRPTPVAHSIAFQLWHAARSSDGLAQAMRARLPGIQTRTGQGRDIWRTERLAERWGLDGSQLGVDEDGFQMDDHVAATLRFPREELLDYARQAFDSAERALEAIGDGEAETTLDWWGGKQPVMWYLLEFLAHDDWSLGAIAALRRAQGLSRILA